MEVIRRKQDLLQVGLDADKSAIKKDKKEWDVLDRFSCPPCLAAFHVTAIDRCSSECPFSPLG
jgi:hypothetical protein